MGKASIAMAERVLRAERGLRVERVSSTEHASHKESLGFGYLKLVILLAMIFLPWAAIIYIARLLLNGH
jgi:hypothetical protein